MATRSHVCDIIWKKRMHVLHVLFPLHMFDISKLCYREQDSLVTNTMLFI